RCAGAVAWTVNPAVADAARVSAVQAEVVSPATAVVASQVQPAGASTVSVGSNVPTAKPTPGNPAASGPWFLACTTQVIVPPACTAGRGASTTACMSAKRSAFMRSISTDGSWSDRRAALSGSLRAVSGKSALSRAWLMVHELNSGEAD